MPFDKVRQRSTILLEDKGRLMLLKMKDPVTEKIHFSLPGGMIEPAESARAAAIRECHEETGYIPLIISEELTLDYVYLWAEKRIHCRSFFFRARPLTKVSPKLNQNEWFIQEAAWVERKRAIALLWYHRLVQQAVTKALNPVN